jgi:hypothetical protein
VGQARAGQFRRTRERKEEPAHRRTKREDTSEQIERDTHHSGGEIRLWEHVEGQIQIVGCAALVWRDLHPKDCVGHAGRHSA